MTAPHKSEGPGTSRASAEQIKQDSMIISDTDGAGNKKTFITLQARLALKGYTALPGTGPSPKYYAGRWGLLRELPDLASLEAFARRVGA